MDGSSASPLTAATLIARGLRAGGVRTVFALAGASHALLLRALDEEGIRIVSTRTEAGTVGAADGYARATGRCGVALIIEDQGIAVAAPALATALHAESSVVVLVARTPTSWRDSEAEIDDDRQPLLAALTKWSRIVPEPARLREYLETAMRKAASGVRGPTALVIPRLFYSATVEGDRWLEAPPAPPTASRPSPEAVQRAAAMVCAARRPVVLAGPRLLGALSRSELLRFSGETGIAVCAQAQARTLVWEDDRFGFNLQEAMPAMPHADLVIALGVRFDQRIGFGLAPRFSPEAALIRVEPAGETAHRGRRADLAIASDYGAFLDALTCALRGAEPKEAWISSALEGRRRAVARALQAGSPGLHPLEIGRALQRHMPDRAALIGDGAAVLTWLTLGYRHKTGGVFMDHYPLGSMGSGTALAFGVAIAAQENGPVAKTVLATGDGAFAYNMTELSEMVAAGIDLTIIVGNDGAWGTEYHGHLKSMGRSINTLFGPQDFAAAARAFGAKGLRAETAADLDAAIGQSLREPGVHVVDAVIDRDAGHVLKTDPDLVVSLFDEITANTRAHLA